MNLRQISTFLLLQILCLPSQAHLCLWCRGPPGYQGPAGPQGPPGPRGNSGFTGAKGRPGSKGAQGPAGFGVRGHTGPPGPQGKAGNNGAQGPPGSKGQLGPPGPQGKAGNNGAPSPPGSKGQLGPPGPQGKAGNNGAPGPPGSKGQTGPPGPQGKAGNNGAQGPPGSKGQLGPPGPQGKAGNNGAQGPPGSKGQLGPPGPQGKAGNNGAQGPPGSKGQLGPPGPQGQAGNNGAPGPPGSKGHTGPPGPQGKAGNNGAQGPPGIKGQLGPPGPQGAQGLSGIGEPGPMGLKGEQGRAGSDGAPGPMGPPGAPGPDYNATWLALLGACQKQKHIPSLIDGAESDYQTYLDDEVLRQKCEDFTARAFDQLHAFIENPIDPDRPKNIIAKTCRDLFIANPDKLTGEYWIDPNGGDDHDKILVRCDAEKGSTCLKPDPARSPNITYAGDKREVWLSEIDQGMQITYTADSSQIAAIQLASTHAEQTVTYHCLKSVGYFDTVGQTYDRGLKLSAWTEVEITPRGRQRLRYNVTLDECQDRENEWGKTVISYETNKPVLLPVVDVGLTDVGKPDQSFSVEIGEVCFS